MSLPTTMRQGAKWRQVLRSEPSSITWAQLSIRLSPWESPLVRSRSGSQSTSSAMSFGLPLRRRATFAWYRRDHSPGGPLPKVDHDERRVSHTSNVPWARVDDRSFFLALAHDRQPGLLPVREPAQRIGQRSGCEPLTCSERLGEPPLVSLRVFDAIAANPVTLVSWLLVWLRAGFASPAVVGVYIVHVDVDANRHRTEFLWRYELWWAADHDNGFTKFYLRVTDHPIRHGRAHPFSEAKNASQVGQCCRAIPVEDVGTDRRVAPTLVMSHCHPPELVCDHWQARPPGDWPWGSTAPRPRTREQLTTVARSLDCVAVRLLEPRREPGSSRRRSYDPQVSAFDAGPHDPPMLQPTRAESLAALAV